MGGTEEALAAALAAHEELEVAKTKTSSEVHVMPNRKNELGTHLLYDEAYEAGFARAFLIITAKLKERGVDRNTLRAVERLHDSDLKGRKKELVLLGARSFRKS